MENRWCFIFCETSIELYCTGSSAYKFEWVPNSECNLWQFETWNFVLGDFPVLKAAIIAELKRDECKHLLFQSAKALIPNNPIVFVRICALLSSEIHHLTTEDMSIPFGGLNGNIAEAGCFLVRCSTMVSEHFVWAFLNVIYIKNLYFYYSYKEMKIFQILFRRMPIMSCVSSAKNL